MKLYPWPAPACAALLSCFACSPDDEEIAVSQEAVTLEILENLVRAGFPENDIQIFEDKVYVGWDAEVTLEASREMVAHLRLDDAPVLEQYRTTNLVSSSVQDICIDGRRFSGTLSTALNRAITNFNALNLSFSMRRISSNRSGCDAVITARAVSGIGGSAGFPSGGLPFGTINVGRDTVQFGTDTTEHVVTHELGHCVGLRHSDYFDRSISCGGSPVNEGQAGVGAILIPGTPSGATVGGSLMNSCFRASETGEFTSTDVIALQTLY